MFRQKSSRNENIYEAYNSQTNCGIQSRRLQGEQNCLNSDSISKRMNIDDHEIFD